MKYFVCSKGHRLFGGWNSKANIALPSFFRFPGVCFRLLCCSSLTFGLRVNKSIIATPAIGIWVGIDWRRAAVALHHLWQLTVGKGKATERNRLMCTLLSLQELAMCSLIFTAKSLWVLLWWWSWNYLSRLFYHVVCPTYQNHHSTKCLIIGGNTTVFTNASKKYTAETILLMLLCNKKRHFICNCGSL